VARVLGIDLGSKRIGVAISDADRTVATPLQVVLRTNDRNRDDRALRDLVEEWEVGLVVVGLPLSLDGSVGRAARAAIGEAERLGATLGVPVETYDERLTTVTAHRSLSHQELSAPERRKVVDMVAAAVLLQAWLDRHAEDTASEAPAP
jgi:putative holliday junction resolvase